MIMHKHIRADTHTYDHRHRTEGVREVWGVEFTAQTRMQRQQPLVEEEQTADWSPLPSPGPLAGTRPRTIACQFLSELA